MTQKPQTITMGGRVLPFALTNYGLLQAAREFEIDSPGDIKIDEDGQIDADQISPQAVLYAASMIYAGTRDAKPRPTAAWIVENLETLEDMSGLAKSIASFFQSLARKRQAASGNQLAIVNPDTLTSGDSPESTSA